MPTDLWWVTVKVSTPCTLGIILIKINDSFILSWMNVSKAWGNVGCLDHLPLKKEQKFPALQQCRIHQKRKANSGLLLQLFFEFFLCHWYKGEVKCVVSDLFIFFSQESSIQLSGTICFFSLAFLFKGSLFTVLNKYVGWTSGWTWAMSVPGWPRRPSRPSLHQKRCCQQ